LGGLGAHDADAVTRELEVDLHARQQPASSRIATGIVTWPFDVIRMARTHKARLLPPATLHPKTQRALALGKPLAVSDPRRPSSRCSVLTSLDMLGLRTLGLLVVLTHNPDETLHVDAVARSQVSKLVSGLRDEIKQAFVNSDLKARLVV
jgi:hypothetical protein